jgi:hypothetical protein
VTSDFQGHSYNDVTGGYDSTSYGANELGSTKTGFDASTAMKFLGDAGETALNFYAPETWLVSGEKMQGANPFKQNGISGIGALASDIEVKHSTQNKFGNRSKQSNNTYNFSATGGYAKYSENIDFGACNSIKDGSNADYLRANLTDKFKNALDSKMDPEKLLETFGQYIFTSASYGAKYSTDFQSDSISKVDADNTQKIINDNYMGYFKEQDNSYDNFKNTLSSDVNFKNDAIGSISGPAFMFSPGDESGCGGSIAACNSKAVSDWSTQAYGLGPAQSVFIGTEHGANNGSTVDYSQDGVYLWNLIPGDLMCDKECYKGKEYLGMYSGAVNTTADGSDNGKVFALVTQDSGKALTVHEDGTVKAEALENGALPGLDQMMYVSDDTGQGSRICPAYPEASQANDCLGVDPDSRQLVLKKGTSEAKGGDLFKQTATGNYVTFNVSGDSSPLTLMPDGTYKLTYPISDDPNTLSSEVLFQKVLDGAGTQPHVYDGTPITYRQFVHDAFTYLMTTGARFSTSIPDGPYVHNVFIGMGGNAAEAKQDLTDQIRNDIQNSPQDDMRQDVKIIDRDIASGGAKPDNSALVDAPLLGAALISGMANQHRVYKTSHPYVYLGYSMTNDYHKAITQYDVRQMQGVGYGSEGYWPVIAQYMNNAGDEKYPTAQLYNPTGTNYQCKSAGNAGGDPNLQSDMSRWCNLYQTFNGFRAGVPSWFDKKNPMLLNLNSTKMHVPVDVKRYDPAGTSFIRTDEKSRLQYVNNMPITAIGIGASNYSIGLPDNPNGGTPQNGDNIGGINGEVSYLHQSHGAGVGWWHDSDWIDLGQLGHAGTDGGKTLNHDLLLNIEWLRDGRCGQVQVYGKNDRGKKEKIKDTGNSYCQGTNNTYRLTADQLKNYTQIYFDASAGYDRSVDYQVMLMPVLSDRNAVTYVSGDADDTTFKDGEDTVRQEWMKMSDNLNAGQGEGETAEFATNRWLPRGEGSATGSVSNDDGSAASLWVRY